MQVKQIKTQQVGIIAALVAVALLVWQLGAPGPTKAAIVVDKANFTTYFSLQGTSVSGNDSSGNPIYVPRGMTYDATAGKIVLTEDKAWQGGSMTLKDQISLDQGFNLSGYVNFGSSPTRGYADVSNGVVSDWSKVGGDGIGFAFFDDKPGLIGLSGNGLGTYGLKNALGFRMDGIANSYSDYPMGDPQANSTLYKSIYGWQYGGFTLNDQKGVMHTYSMSNESNHSAGGRNPAFVTQYQRLPSKPNDTDYQMTANWFDGKDHAFEVNYSGDTHQVQIDIATSDAYLSQAVGQNHLRWKLNIDDYYAMYGVTTPPALSLSVSASTGMGHAQQSFTFKTFNYTKYDPTKLEMDDRAGEVNPNIGKTISHSQFVLTNFIGNQTLVSLKSTAGTATSQQLTAADIASLTIDPVTFDVHFVLTAAGLAKVQANDDTMMTLYISDGSHEYTATLDLYEPLDTWMPNPNLQTTVLNNLNRGQERSKVFDVGTNTDTADNNKAYITYTNTRPSTAALTTDTLKKANMTGLLMLMNNTSVQSANDQYSQYDYPYLKMPTTGTTNQGSFNATQNPTGLEYATNLAALIVPGADLVRGPTSGSYQVKDLLGKITSAKLAYLDISNYSSALYSGLSKTTTFTKSLVALNLKSAGLKTTALNNADKTPTDLMNFINSFRASLKAVNLSSIPVAATTLQLVKANQLDTFTTDGSWSAANVLVYGLNQDLRDSPLSATMRTDSNGHYLAVIPLRSILKGMRSATGTLGDLDLTNYQTPQFSFVDTTQNAAGILSYDTSAQTLTVDWTQLQSATSGADYATTLQLTLANSHSPVTKQYSSYFNLTFPVLKVNYTALDNADQQYSTQANTFRSDNALASYLPLTLSGSQYTFDASAVPGSITGSYGSALQQRATFYLDPATTLSGNTALNLTSGFTGTLTSAQVAAKPTLNLTYRLSELTAFVKIPQLNFGKRIIHRLQAMRYPNDAADETKANQTTGPTANQLTVRNQHVSGTYFDYQVSASATPFTNGHGQTLPSATSLDYDAVNVPTDTTVIPLWHITSGQTGSTLTHDFTQIYLNVPSQEWTANQLNDP